MIDSAGWIFLFPIALVFTAAGEASAASEGAALTPEQERALKALARGEDFSWPEMTPAQTAALHTKAQAYLDIYERFHLPHGLNADLWWHDYDRAAIYRFEVNPNNGQPLPDPAHPSRVAQNTVHMGKEHPSALLLPIRK